MLKLIKRRKAPIEDDGADFFRWLKLKEKLKRIGHLSRDERKELNRLEKAKSRKNGTLGRFGFPKCTCGRTRNPGCPIHRLIGT